MKEKYALVIGGTGMLTEVCHKLIHDYTYVSVVGRSPAKHKLLKNNNPHADRLHAITVDYHDDERFREELQKAFHRFGTPDLVVSWIHGTAPRALDSLLDEMTNVNKTKVWKLFHMQGSSRFFEKENTPVPKNCQYRRIYLGFILEKTTSRWLTHHEIAAGVLLAIETDQLETIVGTLEPWHRRP
ncbi:short-chain dehydrogenase [Virgibacillus flavescens]|uniref:short-chain dehydrogenase n=1 Tax=Virgibacillus flavescens TaxID=1611422 RepID=UPI003D334BCC